MFHSNAHLVSSLLFLDLLVVSQTFTALPRNSICHGSTTQSKRLSAVASVPVNDARLQPDMERFTPLHQNWWPLATVNSLSASRPNALHVFGKSLVAFVSRPKGDDDGESDWVVMNDRCSHRFAPLSEGRIVTAKDEQVDGCPRRSTSSCKHIQCAYHGWEFNASGSCVKLPQKPSAVLERSSKIHPITSYPTQVRVGILWIWTDPESYSRLGVNRTLPVSPVLDEFIDFYGPDSCYMRDSPYGMEFLGENLLDLSHLPFSHHGSGALRRELGGELPMKMIGQTEREELAKAANGSSSKECIVPTLQARILEAGQHDPIFRAFQKYSNLKPDDTWECMVSFFEPNHIRYERLRGGRAPAHQELFLCPIGPGKSRVFLFNARASIAPSSKQQPLYTSFASLFQPNAWKPRLRSLLVSYFFDPRRVSSHMV